MVRRKQKVAVFDVDGTIFRSSLFIELVELMIARGVFPVEARAVYEEKYKEWQNREGGYSEYINAMVDAFYQHIEGVSYKDFAALSKEVVDAQVHHTYRYTRDLVRKLKEDGYYLVAISHSPKTILDFFCPTLGFDKVYGIMFDLDDAGYFTGGVMDKYLIMKKANILHRVVEKENLTLEDSVAVGDTESDISLLEMVENPICFNPNSALYEEAKLRGWEVVVERKDVVYVM
jgi:HAD superfamily hydrolase (TIGR01490 family)